MKPSQKVTDAVQNTYDIHIKDAKKWADLFCRIPIFSQLVTQIDELEDKNRSIEIDDVDGAIFYLILILKNRELPDDPDLVGCSFYPNDIAEIELKSQTDCQDEYSNLQNFFGFKGTWEEVVHRIIEINNTLRPIPHFTL